MFSYYFKLGIGSLRRNPILTALMVLTLAVGVAASISTLTVLTAMMSDPIPEKSRNLLVPLIDNGPVEGYVAGSAQEQSRLPYRDAVTFLNSQQGIRRTAVHAVSGAIEPTQTNLPVIDISGSATTADYFAMFNVPFLYGSAWRAEDDTAAANVVVISKNISEKLFGKENPVGKRIRLFGLNYQIAGVTAEWQPSPRFINVFNNRGGAYVGEEDVLIPFANAIATKKQHDGNTWCMGGKMGPGFQGLLDSECTWVQFWFEVTNAAGRTAVHEYLRGFTADQRKLGRYMRSNKDQVFDVMEWMAHLGVVSDDRKLSVWLAFGFLLLCLVNTVGLLLAKFSTRGAEVGVRRALGASRQQIFSQFFVETAVLGLAGGALGLMLTFGGLWLLSQQSLQIAAVARIDWLMFFLTFALAVSASLIAGIWPTWRACTVSPAAELKSQ
jgi:putative ABC transport system permease protein